MEIFSDEDSITVTWALSTNHSLTGLLLLYRYATSDQTLGSIALPSDATKYTIFGLNSTSGLQYVVCIECATNASHNSKSSKCEATSLVVPSTVSSPLNEEESRKRTLIIAIVIPILAVIAIALLIAVICCLRVAKSRKAGDPSMQRTDSEDGIESHIAQSSQKVLLTDHAKVQSLKHKPSSNAHLYSLSKTNRPPSSALATLQRAPEKPLSTVTLENGTYATLSRQDPQRKNTVSISNIALNRMHSPTSGGTDYNSGFPGGSAIIQTYEDNPEEITLTAEQQAIFDSSEDLVGDTQPPSGSELSLNGDVNDFGSTSKIVG